MKREVLAFSPTDNPEHPGALRLARSAKQWGWNHTFVEQGGWDRDSYRAEQEGTMKFLWTLDWDNPPYVMYMDAWDTLFVGPPQELPLQQGQLEFCGDKKCFPDETHKALYPEVWEGQFRYLNAGVIWGDPFILRELAKEYLELDSDRGVCNQTFFAAAYLKEQMLGRAHLFIDHNADHVLNLWGMSGVKDSFTEVGRKHRRVWYKTRDTFPVVLHAAGSTTFHELPPVPRWIEV